jgi:hypothetical protein
VGIDENVINSITEFDKFSRPKISSGRRQDKTAETLLSDVLVSPFINKNSTKYYLVKVPGSLLHSEHAGISKK